MKSHRLWAPLLVALLSVASLPTSAADLSSSRSRGADPAKLKAQDADKLRLLAKLRGDAPKAPDTAPLANPLDAPIFHRYDRR